MGLQLATISKRFQLMAQQAAKNAKSAEGTVQVGMNFEKMMEKDIVRLADLLGHSSINTTRIYTMESGQTHRQQIERMWMRLIT